MPSIRWDPDLGQYVADTPTGDVYANSHSECVQKMAEALRVAAKHCQVNEDKGGTDDIHGWRRS